MVVRGYIRVLRVEPNSKPPCVVRAIQAEVSGRLGWNLDNSGCGIGRHYGDSYQDPTLVRPDLQGSRFRTTLVEGSDKQWYVLELCEPLAELIHYSAKFHGFEGNRNILTLRRILV